jgi:hypothetical protein
MPSWLKEVTRLIYSHNRLRTQYINAHSIGLKMHACSLKMRVNYTTKLACGANATTPDAVVRLQIIEWTKIITHNQRDIYKISDLADPYCTCIYAGALSPCDVDAHVHRGIHSDPHSWCCVRVMACFLHAERDHSFLGMGFMGFITLKKENNRQILKSSSNTSTLFIYNL